MTPYHCLRITPLFGSALVTPRNGKPAIG